MKIVWLLLNSLMWKGKKLRASRIPPRTLYSLRSGTLFVEFDEYEIVDVPNLVEDPFFVEVRLGVRLVGSC